MFDQFKTFLFFVSHLQVLGRVIALYQKVFLNKNRTKQRVCQYVILVCCLEKSGNQVIPDRQKGSVQTHLYCPEELVQGLCRSLISCTLPEPEKENWKEHKARFYCIPTFLLLIHVPHMKPVSPLMTWMKQRIASITPMTRRIEKRTIFQRMMFSGCLQILHVVWLNK